MKKLTVPCDFNGVKSPFTIYVGSPKDDHHPIHFQSDWLSKERGGNVPQEVMDSLSQLRDIATKNGVSFEDLCVYALGAAQQEEEAGSEDESASEATEDSGATGSTAIDDTTSDSTTNDDQIDDYSADEQSPENITEDQAADDSNNESSNDQNNAEPVADQNQADQDGIKIATKKVPESDAQS
ncbi:MAG: DUF2610 domain-containing protein [Rickettsiales bacterium]|nr:DUF2610 domain-containing protein [Rickettsiales bacterium]